MSYQHLRLGSSGGGVPVASAEVTFSGESRPQSVDPEAVVEAARRVCSVAPSELAAAIDQLRLVFDRFESSGSVPASLFADLVDIAILISTSAPRTRHRHSLSTMVRWDHIVRLRLVLDELGYDWPSSVVHPPST